MMKKYKSGVSKILLSFFMMGIGMQNVLAKENDKCVGFFGKDMMALIKDIYHTLELLMIVALVIFGILDFMHALTGEKDDAFKKAGSKFLKRSIVVMVIVLLPLLINFALSIFWPGLASCVDGI